jgi:hypothetical protein
MSVTILIPYKEEQKLAQDFMVYNKSLLKYPIVVVDSGGGKAFLDCCETYIEKKCDIWSARRIGLLFVETDFVLNLDVDTELPEKHGYIKRAIDLLKDPSVFAVAVDYAAPKGKGHLVFGTSMLRTKDMIEFYDYVYHPKICECQYMWAKATVQYKTVETLPFCAIHHKIKQLL